jgi:hypothetical protein
VIFSEKGLRPTGRTVALTEATPKITGTQRVAPCKERDEDFGEFDGEGIAIADGYVYLTGSHSCSGRKSKYKPSSYLLARFAHSSASSFLDGDPAVERTWRGADMLLNSRVKDSYGKKKGKGTNIEGLAVTGGRLYVGLRTPVGKRKAYIVSAPVAELFARGEQPLNRKSVEPISLKLGKGVGIRRRLSSIISAQRHRIISLRDAPYCRCCTATSPPTGARWCSPNTTTRCRTSG